MSDEQSQPNPDETAGNDPDQSPQAPAESGSEHDSEPETESPKSREAKQRVELRETRARLERMQRAEVERIAAGKLADPGDVWLGGLSVDAVLNDAGDVDSSKVASAIDTLLSEHPHWSTPKPRQPPRYSRPQSGASSPDKHISPSWANALRPGQS